LTIGLNHVTAPVEVREKLSVPAAAVGDALSRLRAEIPVSEAAWLSTCNRSELYLVAVEVGETARAVKEFLSRFHSCSAAALDRYLYCYQDEESVQHIFRVAAGIDSMVIGEAQILAQVKHAFDIARASGSARLLLNELFRRALRVGKRARTETDIGVGALSVGSAAAELAKAIFGDLSGRTIMLLGAGEMGELTAAHLVQCGSNRLLVANRSAERAKELAKRFNGQSVPFDHCHEYLAQVDVLICSTSAPHFLITRDLVAAALRKRRAAPLFLIDIAVPRNVDPEVGKLENVYLYDIDDLEGVVAANRAERENQIVRVEEIIAQETVEFMRWLRGLEVRPVIASLMEKAETIRRTEVEKALRRLSHLSPREQEIVNALVKRVIGKVLHEPLIRLKQSAESKDGYIEVETVRRLFNLDISQRKEAQEHE